MNITTDQIFETDIDDIHAQIFKGLASPARLAILGILQDGEHCVCHIEAHLGFRQAYISQQLMYLRDIGLVQDRRDGRNIFYRVTDKRIYDIIHIAHQMSGKRELTINPNIICNCPKCNCMTDKND